MSPFVLHVIFIMLFDVVGTIAAKLWSIHKNPLYIIATTVLFGAAGFIFARSLRYEGMAITNVLWIALSIIVVTLIGYLYFHEDITTLQLAGIGVITVGLVMINL